MTETVTLQIHGMDCTCNADLLARKLDALAGVQDHEITPVTGQARVRYDPAVVNVQDIIRTVAETGMTASQVRSEGRKSTWWREPQQLALYGSFITAVIAFIAGYFGTSLTIVNGLYLLAVLIGVYYPARKALIALKNLTPTIHLLMLIGAGGAMALGLWGEAAVLIIVYSLGDVLESYAVDKARGAIRSLMALVPKEALVRKDGREMVCAVETINVGETVIVRPGERVPVDGTVVTGSSYVDQAAVTGEPVPVHRGPGEDVFAGTINQNGALEVRVTKPASETMLSRIILSVEEAQAKRTSYQRFSDSFAKWYTPAMFILGVLVATVPPLFFGAEWYPFVYRGLVVFVVSCSCGLALSVPVAVVGAMANAAKQGTVFKGGVYLETIDTVKAIAFDKTGTLTIGRPAVTGVVTFGDLTEDELLDLAGCIESRSGHPLAAAIVRKARESGTFSGRPAEQFEEVAGRGVAATVEGQACRIGSPRAMLEQGIEIGHAEEIIARLESEGQTVVLVSRDGTLVGLVAIADEVRTGAVEALQRLRRAGVRTVMLTGDNERSAQAIARRVGVDEYRAQLLPTDKVDAVRRLKEEYGAVAMVGDGINDAPAMAAADIGIAMGAAGTDIAIEAGDVVLMSDDLGKLAYLRELSHRTVTTIRQNIAVSLINVAFMVVAALLGYLGLVTGLLLNEASAVFVILNALRLLSWRSDAEPGVPAAAGGTAPAIPAAAEPAPVVRCCSCAEPAGGALPVPATTGSCGCSCGEPQIPVAAAEPAPVVECCSCAEPAGGALSVPATAGSGGCSCGEPQIPVAAGTAGACCPGVEHADAVPTSAGAGCSCGEAPTTIPVETEGACYCGEAAGCCGGPAGEALPPAPTPDNGAGASGPVTATFRLEGLGCACAGQMVEKRMKALTGVTGFTLNPITNQLKVTYDPAAVSLDDIVTAAKKAGATAVLLARG
ncbi:heavy metal translocating P-type ATPase [Methanoculleus sp.]|uniref:heavy metal translocating P-type ATPase n=1 Tax=Methanoculleus sp. TaxID=90427 RepID=UPI002FC78E00